MRLLNALKKPTVPIAVASWCATLALSVASLLALPFEPSGFLLLLLCCVWGLAALSLGYAVYTAIFFFPSIKTEVIKFLNNHPLTERLLRQHSFRTLCGAALSLLLNVVYVLFNGILALLLPSLWHASLAAYHLLLTAMRGGLLLEHRRRRKNGLRRYRTVGILLTVLPICLSLTVLKMVTDGRAFVRIGWTVYAFAAFATLKITAAIRGALRARRVESLTVSALSSVGLADAGVSILALQTSLLYSFSDGTSNGFFNALTGAAVSALTLLIGISMLLRAAKITRKNKDLATLGGEKTEHDESRTRHL